MGSRCECARVVDSLRARTELACSLRMVSFVLSKSPASPPPAGPMSLSLSSSVFISLWLDARKRRRWRRRPRADRVAVHEEHLELRRVRLGERRAERARALAVIPLLEREELQRLGGADDLGQRHHRGGVQHGLVGLERGERRRRRRDAVGDPAHHGLADARVRAPDLIDSSRSDREKFDSQPLVSSVNGTVRCKDLALPRLDRLLLLVLVAAVGEDVEDVVRAVARFAERRVHCIGVRHNQRRVLTRHLLEFAHFLGDLRLPLRVHIRRLHVGVHAERRSEEEGEAHFDSERARHHVSSSRKKNLEESSGVRFTATCCTPPVGRAMTDLLTFQPTPTDPPSPPWTSCASAAQLSGHL